jgi:hypothetical protein
MNTDEQYTKNSFLYVSEIMLFLLSPKYRGSENLQSDRVHIHIFFSEFFENSKFVF